MSQLMVIKQKLAENAQAVTRIVPRHVDATRLMRVMWTAIQQTPDLAACTPESLIQSALMAAALGLWPNDGQGLAWIIPYGRRAQLIPGYRGLLTLARQASGVGAVDAGVVYEGDVFDWEEGRSPVLRHVPARAPAFGLDGQVLRPIVAAWMVAQVHGTPQQTVMLDWEIQRIKAKSAGAKRSDSPWRIWPDRMALKTVVRRGCKLLPTSAERLELAQALAIDDAAETGKSQAAAFVIDAGETLADAVPDPDEGAEPARLTGEIQRPATTGDLAERAKARRGNGGSKVVRCDGNHGDPACGDPQCWLVGPPPMNPARRGAYRTGGISASARARAAASAATQATCSGRVRLTL